MQFSDDCYHLHVQLDCKQCAIPPDEQARMQQALERLGQAVMDYAASNLALNVIYHPHSKAYHLEAKLKLPHITLFTSDWDAYLDSAYQRCVSKLINKVAMNQEPPQGRV